MTTIGGVAVADIEVPFATQAGESSVPQNSREVLINMYAQMEVSGRKQMLRRQRPGLRTEVLVSGEKRCIERNGERHFAIIGNTLYRYKNGVLTALGVIGSFAGRCWMIFDDTGRIMISDGLNAYYWNGTVMAPIVTPGGVAVGTLAFQAGFGIFNVPGTGQFYVTNPNDFSTIDALDFATAESYPDPLLRVFVDHNQLLLCGVESIEVWQLSGGTDFPYAPYVNAQIERGIIGPNAICAEDNTVFFVGDDSVVYRLNGYTPTRISTSSIEARIAALTSADRPYAEAFSYTIDGQKFINFRFPGTSGFSCQINLATGLWNYTETFNAPTWRVVSSAGHHSDYLLTPNGFASLDNSLNTDEGDIMRRVAISAPGDANGKMISVSKFQLDAEVGRADIDKASQVMVRVALDGESFGNIRSRGLGTTGNYKRRAIWRNLGQGRRPTIEFSATDDFQFNVVSAIADVTVGST